MSELNKEPPAAYRVSRIQARIVRIDACIARAAGTEIPTALLVEEREACEAELKFMSFKARNS